MVTCPHFYDGTELHYLSRGKRNFDHVIVAENQRDMRKKLGSQYPFQCVNSH